MTPRIEKVMRLTVVAALTGATVVGGMAILERFLLGLGVANFTSISPWGLWMSIYIYFIGLSAGSFLLSSLIYVFGVEKFEPVGRVALFQALVCLLVGLSFILLDLGRPERSFRVLTNWNYTSVLAWEVLFYNAYIAVLCTELWLLMRRDLERFAARARNPLLAFGYKVLSLGRPYTEGEGMTDGEKRAVKILAIAGVPVAIGVHGGTGLIFAVLKVHPYWYSAVFPIIFIVSAMASGGALLTFLTAFFVPLKKAVRKELVPALARLTAYILIADIFLLGLETFLALYGHMPDHTLVFESIFTGPFWWVFWGGELILGMLLPLFVILSPWTRNRLPFLGMACAFIFIGVIGVRLNIVIPPLQLQWNGGLIEEFHKTLTTQAGYVPSINEWLTTIGMVAFGLWGVIAGFRFLPLGGKEKG